MVLSNRGRWIDGNGHVYVISNLPGSKQREELEARESVMVRHDHLVSIISIKVYVVVLCLLFSFYRWQIIWTYGVLDLG